MSTDRTGSVQGSTALANTFGLEDADAMLLIDGACAHQVSILEIPTDTLTNFVKAHLANYGVQIEISLS